MKNIEGKAVLWGEGGRGSANWPVLCWKALGIVGLMVCVVVCVGLDMNMSYAAHESILRDPLAMQKVLISTINSGIALLGILLCVIIFGIGSIIKAIKTDT